MSTQVASLYGLLTLKDDATDKLKGFQGHLKATGESLKSVGTSMMTVTAPITAAFGVAIKGAMDYDEALKNIQAVTGATSAETKALGDQLLAIGANTREGPQAVADAFYDIAGGVSDASVHMETLNAAIKTAQAGNASLAGTTKALIAVMNSYKFSAQDAAYASDVLTRTVGMGVGTMEDFAAALPQATGLANSLGISFGDLGAMAAYLTTQGNTTSQAITQLSAMMTALLNPNESMKAALAELGFASGQAAIESLGLVGAYEALAGTQTANVDGMAKMTGSVEALRGVTALAGPEFQTFADTFTGGIEGATAAAEAVQLDSAAAQFDLLKSSLSAAAIQVGEALLPSLLDLVTQLQPVIDSVTAWINQNPELVTQIFQIAAAGTLLGGGLTVLGTVINGVGTVISVITGVSHLLSLGWGLLSGIGTALGTVFAGVGASATAAIPGIVAMAAPIAAITAAAVAAVLALKQLIDTISMVNAASASARNEISPMLAGGQIGNQDVYDASFRAIQSQWGDLAARLFYTNFAQSSGAKADGGDVYGGQPYLVGERGPEMFVPSSSGSIVSNEAMGGVTINGPITVIANDPAGFVSQLRAARTRQG